MLHRTRVCDLQCSQNCPKDIVRSEGWFTCTASGCDYDICRDCEWGARNEKCCQACQEASESNDLDVMIQTLQMAYNFMDSDGSGSVTPEKYAQSDKRIQNLLQKTSSGLVRTLQNGLRGSQKDLENALLRVSGCQNLLVIVQTIELEHRAATQLVQMKLSTALSENKRHIMSAVLNAANQWDDYLKTHKTQYLNLGLVDQYRQMIADKQTDGKTKEIIRKSLTYLESPLYPIEAGKREELKRKLADLERKHKEDSIRGQLQEALKKRSLPLLKAAVQTCKNMGLPTDEPINCMKQVFLERLSGSPEDILAALNDLEGPYKRILTAHDQEEISKQGIDTYRSLKGLPANWQMDRSSLGGTVKHEIVSGPLFEAMQHLMNQTFDRKWTQDRKVQTGPGTKGHPVPDKLVLKMVQTVQNEQNYVEYMGKRREIMDHIGDPASLKSAPDDPSVAQLNHPGAPGCMMTYNARQQWKDLLPPGSEEPLATDFNEFYMFHGTKPYYIESITEGDFLVKMAGTSAGTLYGRGVYIGESCTKGDEYAFRNDPGYEYATKKLPPNGLRCMLLLRAMLGRVRYNDERAPADPSALEDCCLHGNYNSILGDRKKISGTFREFVVFDKDQLYPEYVLWFTRAPEP